jgi:hypothetical protein
VATQPELLAWHYQKRASGPSCCPAGRATCSGALAYASHPPYDHRHCADHRSRRRRALQQRWICRSPWDALMVTIGLSPGPNAYDRARLLCQQLGIEALRGTVRLARWYMNQTEFCTAQECGELLTPHNACTIRPCHEAYRMLGNIVFWRGELVGSRAPGGKARPLSRASSGCMPCWPSRPWREMRGFVALTLWFSAILTRLYERSDAASGAGAGPSL